MFGSMPFRYGKVNSGSSTDDEQPHAGPRRVTFWSRVLSITHNLRWPTTIFLLFVILAAQIQILHRQPSSNPTGSEINGLIPTCACPQPRPPQT